jgi:hypothetical protein
MINGKSWMLRYISTNTFTQREWRTFDTGLPDMLVHGRKLSSVPEWLTLRVSLCCPELVLGNTYSHLGLVTYLDWAHKQYRFYEARYGLQFIFLTLSLVDPYPGRPSGREWLRGSYWGSGYGYAQYIRTLGLYTRTRCDIWRPRQLLHAWKG